MTERKPTLWHIPVSHYSEKIRWALDHKGIEHERHAPPPGAHIPVALWLTRGSQWTFPVVSIDGRSVGDSTAIIEALEHRYAAAPLYPEDPAQLRRALELEDFFDEELGPQIRRLAWHDLIADPERMREVASGMLPGPVGESRVGQAAAGRFASAYVRLRFRVADDEAAEVARGRVVAALERLESELDASGGEYLAGEGFSVADLTAASLFYPLVQPPEGPQVLAGADPPEPFQRFREGLADRPGYRWVESTFRRHRR